MKIISSFLFFLCFLLYFLSFLFLFERSLEDDEDELDDEDDEELELDSDSDDFYFRDLFSSFLTSILGTLISCYWGIYIYYYYGGSGLSSPHLKLNKYIR